MMIANRPHIERTILIFAIWGVLGFLGLGVFLEGMKSDLWPLSSAGVLLIVFAFVAHIIVNGIFKAEFSPGEAALGIGVYGILGLVFIVSAATGGLTMADYYSGLTLFGVLAVGFLAYLFTRHGLRGAFSRFHIKSIGAQEESL
ncbi:hypothetical protein M2360_001012 [Rhizobium sp. SG_E_25_P2]|uniref:hypothetical protein n=1 Tax=Rhizobium sp. SG_E_25_P2 TaxID=2879942 RepID=UPI00247458AA|nr:hypothetical protein [Rhizobium sp. SG_E_25_P2]MDH6265622.1 hypothetical protein [Rhizobium sp. SG_E_25_P2]